MKLKTKIEQGFNIDEEEMDNLDFTIEFEKEKIKRKSKLVEIKRKNIRKDSSTKLF